MAMINPVGRVNYEPNSCTGDERGPARTRTAGSLVRRRRAGDKRRLRPASFADHYSQAGLFFRSQTAGRAAAHRSTPSRSS